MTVAVERRGLDEPPFVVFVAARDSPRNPDPLAPLLIRFLRSSEVMQLTTAVRWYCSACKRVSSGPRICAVMVLMLFGWRGDGDRLGVGIPCVSSVR